MNRYAHAAELTRTVHDALVGWARDLLKQADLETVEVYGQFPPEGTTASHMVLFPYWVGPLPKMVEQGREVSLMNPPEQLGDGKISFIPTGYQQLGRSLANFTRSQFPDMMPMVGSQQRKGSPFPLFKDMPKSLQKWYKDHDGEEVSWISEWDGKSHALPPALQWAPGIHVVVRYIAIASDPGRGTSQYSSTGAPLALPALSVLAMAVHLERRLMLTVKPPPLPDDLTTYVEAVIAARKGKEKKELKELLSLLETPEEIGIAITPVDDLSNQEFALLMQALQRPLQAALNFQMRVVLGARAEFEPGMVTRTRPPKPTGGFFQDDGSG